MFTSGLTFPILFGFYKKKTKVTSFGALMSLVCGGGISLVWLLYNHPLGIDAVLIGMIVSIIPLIVCRGDNYERTNSKTI